VKLRLPQPRQRFASFGSELGAGLGSKSLELLLLPSPEPSSREPTVAAGPQVQHKDNETYGAIRK